MRAYLESTTGFEIPRLGLFCLSTSPAKQMHCKISQRFQRGSGRLSHWHLVMHSSTIQGRMQLHCCRNMNLRAPTLAVAGCYTALQQTDGMIVTKLHSNIAKKITKLEGEVPDSIANCTNDSRASCEKTEHGASRTQKSFHVCGFPALRTQLVRVQNDPKAQLSNDNKSFWRD